MVSSQRVSDVIVARRGSYMALRSDSNDPTIYWALCDYYSWQSAMSVRR
jgi:hypothetical protein